MTEISFAAFYASSHHLDGNIPNNLWSLLYKLFILMDYFT